VIIKDVVENVYYEYDEEMAKYLVVEMG